MTARPLTARGAVRLLSNMPAPVSSMAIADINNDGRMEIVAGIDAGTSSEQNAIYALYCDGDNPMTDSWRMELLATVTYAVNVVKIGDLDGDTWDDIVFGTVHAPPVGTLQDPVDDSEWPDVYQLRALHNNGDDTWMAYDLGRDPGVLYAVVAGLLPRLLGRLHQ